MLPWLLSVIQPTSELIRRLRARHAQRLDWRYFILFHLIWFDLIRYHDSKSVSVFWECLCVHIVRECVCFCVVMIAYFWYKMLRHENINIKFEVQKKIILIRNNILTWNRGCNFRRFFIYDFYDIGCLSRGRNRSIGT